MPAEARTRMIAIRAPIATDHPAWLQLWSGYLAFYKHELPAAVTEHTWQQLLRDEPPMQGIMAIDDAGKPVGFAHYVVHASTWTLKNYCYLEDLFVRPDCRATGIGRTLIEHLYKLADQNGWSRVYWMTQENNYRGRTLYDRVGRRSEFVLYERED